MMQENRKPLSQFTQIERKPKLKKELKMMAIRRKMRIIWKKQGKVSKGMVTKMREEV